MNMALQRQLADEAGQAPTGESWKEEYDYHLSVIDPPLMFGVFKMKFCGLDKLFLRHPDDFTSAMEKLTNELGY